MGKIVNLAELAEITGKSLPTVRSWVRSGMPTLSQGSKAQSWQIDASQAIEWLQDRAVANAVGDTSEADTDELKRRKLAAETAMAEIDLALRRGDALAAADVGRAWADLVIAFRAKVLGVPAKLAPVLLAETDLLVVRNLMEDALHEALQELADDDEFRDGERGAGDAPGDMPTGASLGKAAAETNRKRVGRPA